MGPHHQCAKPETESRGPSRLSTAKSIACSVWDTLRSGTRRQTRVVTRCGPSPRESAQRLTQRALSARRSVSASLRWRA
ncbi:hypothetical protein ACFPRL_36600 [Pseudoclavibacter helvolus]